MDKGISVYFGFSSPIEERIKKIKEAGFDSVIANADPRFDYQNGSIKEQMKLCKKYGLKLSSLHARYLNSELKYFFENGKIGDKLEKNLIKDIKIAHKYGFRCVVAHMDGENNPIGLERLKRVLHYARKYKIPLAIENIHANNSLDYIFENLEDEYLKFCFDSGHEHTFSPNRSLLNEYGEKLVTLHLHDNDGTADQHTLNQFGSIDWKKLAKMLAKCTPVSLDYELLLYSVPNNLTEDEALKLCYQNAVELEKMIESEKSKKLKSIYKKFETI